jgi:hypothetical protein
MKMNPSGGATLLATRLGLSIAILFFALAATAQTTKTLSNAEIQGQELAQEIQGRLAQPPAGNFTTNTGVLRIRGDHDLRQEVAITCVTSFTGTNWQAVYRTSWTNRMESLLIIHDAGGQTRYYCRTNDVVPILGTLMPENLFRNQPRLLSGVEIEAPFAGSDFWISDLGLEFIYWPGQKVIKRETHRSCGCTVLESTNPDPAPNSYARVVSWIDNDTLGIVEAYAYDANGKKLKDFYPKDFKKVDGRWQVQTLVMENVQTGSRSRLEFDLKK